VVSGTSGFRLRKTVESGTAENENLGQLGIEPRTPNLKVRRGVKEVRNRLGDSIKA